MNPWFVQNLWLELMNWIWLQLIRYDFIGLDPKHMSWKSNEKQRCPGPGPFAQTGCSLGFQSEDNCLSYFAHGHLSPKKIGSIWIDLSWSFTDVGVPPYLEGILSVVRRFLCFFWHGFCLTRFATSLSWIFLLHCDSQSAMPQLGSDLVSPWVLFACSETVILVISETCPGQKSQTNQTPGFCMMFFLAFQDTLRLLQTFCLHLWNIHGFLVLLGPGAIPGLP